jgi:hypothetical protein
MENRSTTAYAASLVISASPAKLHRVTIFNNAGTALFVQLHDAASLPADTAVPKAIIRIATASSFVWDFGDSGRIFNTGIVICNSTSGATKTIGGAECWFDAQISAVDDYSGRGW